MGEQADDTAIEFIDPDPDREITGWEFDPAREGAVELQADGTLEVQVSRKALEKNRGFELDLPEDATTLRVVRAEE